MPLFEMSTKVSDEDDKDEKDEKDSETEDYVDSNIDARFANGRGGSSAHSSLHSLNTWTCSDIWTCQPDDDRVDREECLFELEVRRLLQEDRDELVEKIKTQPYYRIGIAFKVAVEENDEAFFRTLLGPSIYNGRQGLLPDNQPLVHAAKANHFHFVHILVHEYLEEIEAPHDTTIAADDHDAWKTLDDEDPHRKATAKLAVLRAMSSPAYLITRLNPFDTGLDTCRLLRKCREHESCFSQEYASLERAVVDFLCQLVDQCHETDEVEEILQDIKQPARASNYHAKKLVSHPFVQEFLWRKFIGADERHVLAPLLHLHPVFRWPLWLPIQLALIPIYLLYAFNALPKKVCRILIVPQVQFYASSTFYVFFLLALLASSTDPEDRRPDTVPWAHILVFIFLLGLLFQEMHQITIQRRHYLSFMFNWLDLILLACFISSFGARFFALGETNRARSMPANFTAELTYYAMAARSEWNSHDPLVVSEMLYAIGVLVAVLRFTSVLSTFQAFGPMLRSFGKMFDVASFLFFAWFVFFAFLLCFLNLSWYMVDEESHTQMPFMKRFLYLLSWLLHRAIDLDPPHTLLDVTKRTSPESMNVFLMVLHLAFRLVVTIVLLNTLLVALLTKSFDTVWDEADVEWKYARAALWLEYIEHPSALPVPFNLLLPCRLLIKSIQKKCNTKRREPTPSEREAMLRKYNVTKSKLTIRLLQSKQREGDKAILRETIMWYANEKNLKKIRTDERA